MYVDYSGHTLVSIRSFVNRFGGTVIWLPEFNFAAFELNGKILRTPANGKNLHGMYITNKNSRMMAHNNDLAYFFRVDNWSTYFPDFTWYPDSEGFQVYTTKHFSYKTFCLDFADNIIEIKGKGYCGMTALDIAIECYAHRMILQFTQVTIYYIDRGHQYYASAREIGIEANDPNKFWFERIWYNTSILDNRTVFNYY